MLSFAISVIIRIHLLRKLVRMGLADKCHDIVDKKMCHQIVDFVL